MTKPCEWCEDPGHRMHDGEWLCEICIEYDQDEDAARQIEMELAWSLCEDLPDGAALAMFEDMTGLEPADFLAADEDD